MLTRLHAYDDAYMRLAGLAAWLGCGAQLEALDKSLKKQNPAPMSEKVSNHEEMAAALARLDRFNLGRTPNFEPRRGPAVPTYIAAAEAPLLYLPVKGGPEAAARAAGACRHGRCGLQHRVCGAMSR